MKEIDQDDHVNITLFYPGNEYPVELPYRSNEYGALLGCEHATVLAAMEELNSETKSGSLMPRYIFIIHKDFDDTNYPRRRDIEVEIRTGFNLFRDDEGR